MNQFFKRTAGLFLAGLMGTALPLQAAGIEGIDLPGSSMIDNVLYRLLENGTSSISFYDDTGNLLQAQSTISTENLLETDFLVDLAINPINSAALSNAPLIELYSPAECFALLEVEDLDVNDVIFFYQDGQWVLEPSCIDQDSALLFYLEQGDNQIRVVDNEKDFLDLTEVAWADEAIHYVSAREIMNAMQPGYFFPYESVSRGMLVQILYNFFGHPQTNEAFRLLDMDASQYYYDAALWALQQGIVHGSEQNGTRLFLGDDLLTREELAVILQRFCSLEAESTGVLSDYEDRNEIEPWASEAMAFMVEIGLMGQGTDQLRPQATLERYELAVIIMRFLQTSFDLI